MNALKNAFKGVSYQNPALGERLYELCRKATSRHIDRPDEIINQQVCGGRFMRDIAETSTHAGPLGCL